tara:strand:- start:708 stop:1316 length:609 start_codon:yes stop_codon:yes gene_type:complete
MPDSTNTMSPSILSTAKYTFHCMMLLAGVGILVKMFLAQGYSSDGSTGPANAVIWGYGLVAMAIFCTMFVSYALYDQAGRKELNDGKLSNITKFIGELVKQFIPAFITLFILCWLVVINSLFAKQINMGDVTPVYTNMSWTVSLLLLFQVILTMTIAIKKLDCSDSDNVVKQMKAASWIIGAISFVMVGIMNMNLLYFSTDG